MRSAISPIDAGREEDRGASPCMSWRRNVYYRDFQRREGTESTKKRRGIKIYRSLITSPYEEKVASYALTIHVSSLDYLGNQGRKQK